MNFKPDKTWSNNRVQQPRRPHIVHACNLNRGAVLTASFPWYDLPSVRWANDALWRATGLPGELNRSRPACDHWLSPDLVISQACGLDLFLSDAPIEPVLVPILDLDCEPGHYYSYLIGTATPSVAAVNSLTSRSGLSALLGVTQPESLLVTGSHRASIEAVRRGSADCACIDAVTWHILERDEPDEVAGISIIDRTSAAPAPPFVIRESGLRFAVNALVSAMAKPETYAARRALLMRGVKPTSKEAYASVHLEYQAIVDKICVDINTHCVNMARYGHDPES